MSPDKPAMPAIPGIPYEHADEMYEAYANNVYYETSAWDLKLIFGQLDQSEGRAKIVQHSAITLPWPLIKIMIYWLRGQVEFQEARNGKIHISPNIIPPEIPSLPEDVKKADPTAETALAIFTRLRQEFIDKETK